MDKRYIAPIIITILAVIYFLLMGIGFVFALSEGMPAICFMLLLFIPIGAAALTVYMLIERLNEIKGGEEDEASKY